MSMPKVYLAGPISGQSYDGATAWRTLVADELLDEIECYDPMRGKGYLSGEKGIKDHYDEFNLSRTKGVVARDYFDVQRCDALLVNLLGATKVSIGTVMEIAWAYDKHKPVVLVMEKGNVHEHGMILECCGYVVGSLEEAIGLIRDILLTGHTCE